MMTTKVVICLAGCLNRRPTERKLRIETQRRSQPRSRKMITQEVKVQECTTEGKCIAGPCLTRTLAKKTDRIHPIKVKEAVSSVDKSTIEDL